MSVDNFLQARTRHSRDSGAQQDLQRSLPRFAIQKTTEQDIFAFGSIAGCNTKGGVSVGHGLIEVAAAMAFNGLKAGHVVKHGCHSNRIVGSKGAHFDQVAPGFSGIAETGGAALTDNAGRVALPGRRLVKFANDARIHGLHLSQWNSGHETNRKRKNQKREDQNKVTIASFQV